MKLEFKHLAPYLPYKLKMIFEGKGGRILEATGLRVAGISDKTSKLLYFNSISETLSCGYFKPILRPIFDAKNKEFIEKVKSLRFGTDTYFFLHYSGQFNIKTIPYEAFQFLLENHFDIFGLIPLGLAVSIHDVGQVVA